MERATRSVSRASRQRNVPRRVSTAVPIPAPAPAPVVVEAEPTAEDQRECNICYETKPVAEFLMITEACEHAACSCRGCVVLHVREEINGKNRSSHIQCAQPGCECYLQPHDIRRFTDRALYLRYDHFLLQEYLRGIPDFRWCANPNGCGSGQIIEDAENMSFFRCTHCLTCTCVFHRLPWHSGVTCDEFEEQLQEADRDNEAWKLANTKNCPHCHRPIEKNDGCDVMRCCVRGDDGCRRLQRNGQTCDHGGLCGQRFCWLCLGIIDDDGTRHHLPSCQYCFDA